MADEGYAQGPHSHNLMTGGGGGSEWFFLGLKFWPKVIFGSMKDAGIFLGREKKTEEFFWIAKKGLRTFLGMLKK